MIKKFLYIAIMFILASTLAYASVNDELIVQMQREIQTLHKQQTEMQTITTRNFQSISARVELNESRLDTITSELAVAIDSIGAAKACFSKKIGETNYVVQQNEAAMSSSINNRTIFGGIAFLLLAAFGGLIIFLFRRRMAYNGSAIESIRSAQEELSKAQKKIEEESVKLDSKLVDLLDRQVSTSDTNAQVAPDHSLALKVADEIVRIELNLSRMDKSIKGYKQLSKAVERIKNNYLAKGYEITDLLGKPYNEGMRINADFVIDESLPLGTRTITSITKPQVIYNGEMIQKAIVTISQNI